MNASTMAKEKGWKKEKFEIAIDSLRKEGIVWVDRKTKSGEPAYYFPSMLNSYVDNSDKYSPFLQ